MSQTATFYERFFMGVSAGMLVTLLGAILLLIVGVLVSRHPEPFAGDRQPARLKALSVLGFAFFLVGIAWQLVGYFPYVRWP